MPERTDEEVAVEVQKGDMESFRILVERYEAKMSRYAKRFLFAPDDADDLLQEIFIKAYVNIRSFDASRRFSPWLYRIAHNEFINALKKKKKDRNNISLFYVDVLFPHPVARETADDATSRREIREVLDGSLEKLGPKYREPLVLYYLEDMNYKEIAEVLHIPVSTVGVRLQRGKTLLRQLVKRVEGD
ncbi:MAG TPA: RNA polymerase sigma factor [Candidatus Paceibacterota bacterium]|nr:RNA polymerase sigma factor [Candidatus Paceibacterota bacterium]